MVNELLLSLLLMQAKPAAPQPQPTTPPKAAPAQPRRTTPTQKPATNTVSGMAITVTDGRGTPFSDVTVEMTGTISRTGKTNDSGQLSLPGLKAGTYRLRFSGDTVTAFEREITLKAGEIVQLPITLSAAPPKPVAPPPPAPVVTPPPAPVVGPAGNPQLGSLTTLADRERSSKERKEILLSCSGNTRNMLLVLIDEQAQRVYDDAELSYYVISGQGGARVGGIESMISEGSFISIPRGTPFTIGRRGNRPLTMLWTLSGVPCEKAR